MPALFGIRRRSNGSTKLVDTPGHEVNQSRSRSIRRPSPPRAATTRGECNLAGFAVDGTLAMSENVGKLHFWDAETGEPGREPVEVIPHKSDDHTISGGANQSRDRRLLVRQVGTASLRSGRPMTIRKYYPSS